MTLADGPFFLYNDANGARGLRTPGHKEGGGLMMKKDAQTLRFRSRTDFRAWLQANAASDEGIWLLFGKTKELVTLSAAEALEEALCFGWIDGQMQRVDEHSYLKYFKQRAPTGNWSEKNQKLAETLERQGLMTDAGRAKIEFAKRHGTWGTPPNPPPLTDELLQQFCEMIRPAEPAFTNLMHLPPSARKTYASSYFFGAKTEQGKQKRLAAIIERLNLNLDPMQSLQKALAEARRADNEK